jgi:UDP-N-acetylmuramoyl-L-alanyl-D-glutamate--2,6-diaminopimelate ligase
MTSKSVKFYFQKIKNIFWHYPKNIFLTLKYHHPAKKLTLIGITGTDGKTTTCSLIYETLKKAGLNAGVITTIGAKFGNDQEIDTGLHMTSPDPYLIQQILSQMVKVGVTHVVCEVTAHALDQHRFYGCHFQIALVTNTSHEHLDYFLNMENYIQAKSKIFKQAKISILNKDDPSFGFLSSKNPQALTYSIDKKSNFQAKNVKPNQKGISFSVNGQKITTDTIYHYQIYNILASLAVISELNIDTTYLSQIVENFPATKGRREEIPNGLGINAIVDFAHTPNAIKNTLSSLRQVNQGKIIAIFGATGGRDQSKRPEMGLVTSQLADIAIITSDDTRNEDINNINQQIISGIQKNALLIESNDITQIKNIIKDNPKKFIYFNLPNRQDAFNLAVKLAKDKDIIIAMGKGHESSILLGKTEYPWSESQAFRLAFSLKNKK